MTGMTRIRVTKRTIGVIISIDHSSHPSHLVTPVILVIPVAKSSQSLCSHSIVVPVTYSPPSHHAVIL